MSSSNNGPAASAVRPKRLLDDDLDFEEETGRKHKRKPQSEAVAAIPESPKKKGFTPRKKVDLASLDGFETVQTRRKYSSEEEEDSDY